MMLQLLYQGHIALFALIIFVIVFSLTFHEFGHAFAAKFYGDDTAERLGRLTLNPLPHIDPFGLLMVVMIGFGFAKPVPVTPGNFTRPWASAVVAAAGPFMNLVLAFIAINLWVLGESGAVSLLHGVGQRELLSYMALINAALMLFNLLPVGPLDGHYIMSYLLPRKLGQMYDMLNARFGVMLFMGLIVLSILGVPVFTYVRSAAMAMLSYLVVV
jgi:Zn-dependent protease